MYYDCYVLIPTRTRELAYSYLNTFAPDREALSDAYEVPFWGKVTTHEFDTADKLIDYLISNPTTQFSISWRNGDRSIGLHNIDLHFTDDGHLILGLSCIADDAFGRSMAEKNNGLLRRAKWLYNVRRASAAEFRGIFGHSYES